MKISGKHSFSATREQVWDALLDPTVLSSILPGCDELERTAENQFQGAMDLKVGPVQGRFQGTVDITEPRRPETYTLKLDGRGAPGWVRATTSIELTEDAGATTMAYDGDAQVGGRIASVGQRLLDSSSRSIIRQSLEGLERALAARTEPQAEADGTAVETATDLPEAPSQSEFAARVAKDVAKEIIPRPVLIGGAILLILALLFLLLR